jgi:nicotinamidase-related amidase
MPPLRVLPERSILVVVDQQPNMMAAIHDAERVDARSLFLARVAHLLDIPVLATEQNPSRLGELSPAFEPYLSAKPIPKQSFSCHGSREFKTELEKLNRKQVVLVGVETHICVCLTALDLLAAGYEVVVCPDAVSSRTMERHKLGMERIRDSGAIPSHTETLAYEWLGTADHIRFREALAVVKNASF